MDVNNSLSSSNLHEVVFSDRHYINKLQEILDLIEFLQKSQRLPGQNIFMLIRPRGFGLSIATEAFESLLMRDELLIDHIQSKYNNAINLDRIGYSPVIRISYNTLKSTKVTDFYNELLEPLQRQLWEHHIKLKSNSTHDLRVYMLHLIRELSDKEKAPVVILIDNYDIPLYLIKTMKKEDREEAMDLYLSMLNAIRQAGNRVRFCLLTGHVKFALSTNVSEGLPHIIDLSFCEETSTLFGFTIEEVKSFYEEELARLAPQNGVTVSEYLNALNRCYGGYVFSDSMIPVMCPNSVTRALDNDGELYPYACNHDFEFLQASYEEEQPDLEWLFNKDGQDNLVLEEVGLFPQGKEFGSLLLQLGFVSVNKVTFSEQEQSMSWRYRFGLTNVEMRRAFKIVTGQASPGLREQKINPLVFDDGEDEFDLEKE